LQKIIAFENAFDRIFELVMDPDLEPLTCIDCLQFLRNLLRDNASNQSLFRENGCIPRLVTLLEVYLTPEEENEEKSTWETHKSQCCEVSLHILRSLVVPGSANAIQAQGVLFSANIMTQLLEFSLSNDIPVALRGIALHALGDLIRGHAASQTALADSLVYVAEESEQQTKSSLLLIVNLAVTGLGEESIALRKSALHVVHVRLKFHYFALRDWMHL
jgi:hypothetical protein